MSVIQRASVRGACRLLVFASLLLSLGACGETECGEGTHLEGGKCVASISADCTGPGVALRDGRCQVSAEACAAGTVLDAGICVPVGEVVEPNDAGTDADVADAADAAGDVSPLPACGETSPIGFACFSGFVIDWSTGLPVGADEPLGVIVDDLTLRNQDPTRRPFGSAAVGEGGTFVMELVPTVSADGPLQQIIFVVDEPEEVSTNEWQRTLTGVPATAQPGESLRDLVAYSVPGQLVDRWNVTLGLTSDELLEQVGFMVIRVLDGDGMPVAGATIRAVEPGNDALLTKHYLSADLLEVGANETSASGAVLVLGGPVGQYTASAAGLDFAPTLGGATPGLAVATTILGAPR